MNKKEVKMVMIDQSNIDDVFIYKHKIEEDIAKENNEDIKRMKIDEFINDYLHLSDNSFYCAKTQEAVAYVIKNIRKELVCFYTKASDDTISGFKDAMDKIKWDIEKLSSQAPKDVYEDITNTDFFMVGNDMKTV